jgi:hypothetical protein
MYIKAKTIENKTNKNKPTKKKNYTTMHMKSRLHIIIDNTAIIIERSLSHFSAHLRLVQQITLSSYMAAYASIDVNIIILKHFSTKYKKKKKKMRVNNLWYEPCHPLQLFDPPLLNKANNHRISLSERLVVPCIEKIFLCL